ncbi:tetratricopeptide repeat protein [Cohnella faecalis]|uniref:Tetratricopeptide repeat protein n=2 Tax=Cohnella faecalis TaxID=2315694 RepID=A0A398D271_9BACL|nr:tetratricopeptide repeat protein [Cohnella faecalis]RIE05204.1 tetratricopeptide repeat protein [Cohnella faecalis]
MSIESFCKELGVVVKEGVNLVENFKKILSNNVKINCLLIFDNALDEEKLSNYIPYNYPNCDIIVTSTNPNWRNSLPIDILLPEDACKLISSSTNANEGDESVALELCSELGYLPLALEQAAAYIREVGLSIYEYLQKFKKYRAELAVQGKPLNYDKNIATTWKLLLNSITENIEITHNLFTYICFLAPDRISKDYLLNKKISPVSDTTITSELILDKIIAQLRRLSLVKIVDGRISIHRLVVAMTIDLLESEQRAKWIQLHVDTVLSANKEQRTGSELLHHRDYLIKHIIDNQIFNENIAELIASQAKVHLALSYYENALSLSMFLYTNTTTYLNNSPELLAEAALRLGAFHFTQGHYIEARNFLLEAYQSLPENSENLLNVLNTLINVERESGKFESALEYLEKAEQFIATTTGNDGYDAILNSKGRVLIALSRYDEAEITLNKSLETAREYDQPSILSNLGQVYEKKGDLKKAIQYYHKSIEISKKYFQEAHEHFAREYSNLGLAYYKLYDAFHAKRYLRKALEIISEINPLPNIVTAHITNNLGMAYELDNKIDDALKYYLKSKEIFKLLNQELNEDNSNVLYNIGGAYQFLGNFKEAELHVLQALAIDRAIFKDNHPEVAKDLGKLAVIMMDINNYKKAVDYLNQSEKIYRNNGLTNSLDYASTIGHRASALYMIGQNKAAKADLKNALAIIHQNYGQENQLAYNLFNTFVSFILKTNNLQKEAEFIIFIQNNYFN